MKKQSGFTLIELIMVIVILGILAATAAPKFSNLRQESQLAVFKGIQGSMMTASAAAHGMWLAQGLSGVQSNLTYETGNVISMVYGYPSSGVSGIFATLDLPAGAYAMSDVPGYIYKTSVIGASAATCGAQFNQSTGFNVPPTVTAPTTTNVSDC